MIGAFKRYTFVDWATQAYCALVGLLLLFFHNQTVPTWPRLLVFHVLFIVAIHGLISLAARGWGGKTLEFFRYFYPFLIYGWFYSETAWLNRLFFHAYLDATVIQWEQALFGTQPSVIFMQKLPYLVVSEMFYLAYFSYYLMIGAIGLTLYFRQRQQFLHYVSVVSFLFYLCYILFIIFPIIGPPVFFHPIDGYTLPAAVQHLAPTTLYPDSVKSGIFFRLMAWIYRGFESPGAALPSSHVAVALCTLYFSFRYLRPIRYFHLVAVILLCLATVYCRYHYALDVLTGTLTAALVVPLGNWLYFKTLSKDDFRAA
jgi:membrane-associated phospholipid phosphatase